MTHPELAFFVNEVGDNVSQKADGNINGENLIITKNCCALTHLLLNDSWKPSFANVVNNQKTVARSSWIHGSIQLNYEWTEVHP